MIFYLIINKKRPVRCLSTSSISAVVCCRLKCGRLSISSRPSCRQNSLQILADNGVNGQ